MANVTVKVRTIEEGSESVKNVNDQLSSLQKQALAVAAALGTFKKAFDLSRQGAQVGQLRDSFNRLNEEVFHMPDLLEDMQKATNDTVSDVDLMSGALTLVAGTSGDMSRALAAATPNILEMAKAANAVNPMLGDTTFLFESLSIAAKRQSRLLADNAGVIVSMERAVKEVHPALQNLADTYEELPESVRFLNEMLFQGNNLIVQAGDSAESSVDSWDKLTTAVKNTGDALKETFADQVAPIVDAAAGTHADAIGNIVDQNIDAAESMDDLVDAVHRLREAELQWEAVDPFLRATIMRETAQEFERSTVDIISEMARASGSVEEFMDGLAAAFGTSAKGWNEFVSALSTEEFNELAGATDMTIQGFFEWQLAMAQTKNSAEALRGELLGLKQDQAGMVPPTEDVTASAEEQTEAFKDLGVMTEMEEAQLLDLHDATVIYNRVAEETSRVTEEATGHTESYWRAIEEASDRLIKAEAAQRAANKAFGEDFLEAMDTDAVDGVTASMDDLERVMLESAAASGISREGMLALSVATEELTEDQAESILKHLAMIEKAEELGRMIANEEISFKDARQALIDYDVELESDHTIALDHSAVDEAERRVDSVTEKMMRLDNMEAHMTAILTVQQSMAIPDAFMSGGTIGGIPENRHGGPVRSGEWSIVGEDGPELVRFGHSGRVFSNEQSMGMMGGAAGTWTGDLVIQGADDPAATARAVEQRLIDRGIIPRGAMR